jgi:CheY-like chemotaxis protein
MVHGMAQQSGGKLRLKSKAGVGTVAELCLPIAPDKAGAATEDTKMAEASPSRKLVILSVDDDPLVALNTTALLEELGHQVYAASSGTAALDILRAQNIDLLLTDQGMPVMTGLELVDAARKIKPDLPVVMATGYAELPEGQGGTLQKLAKPFSQRDLLDAISGATMNVA